VPYTRALGTARPTGWARAYSVHQDVVVFRADGGPARRPRPADPLLPPALPDALGTSHRPAA
nr:hypothetical protein [Micromonospora sp. DSM 115978]